MNYTPTHSTVEALALEVFPRAICDVSLLMKGYTMSISLGVFNINILQDPHKGITVKFELVLRGVSFYKETYKPQSEEDLSQYIRQCRLKMQGIYFSLQEILED